MLWGENRGKWKSQQSPGIESRLLDVRLRHFSPTCAVHIEDCGGWWLSSCRSSVAEHCRLKPEVSWVQFPVFAGFSTFLYFRLITSKYLFTLLEFAAVVVWLHTSVLVVSFPCTGLYLENRTVKIEGVKVDYLKIFYLGWGRGCTLSFNAGKLF